MKKWRSFFSIIFCRDTEDNDIQDWNRMKPSKNEVNSWSGDSYHLNLRLSTSLTSGQERIIQIQMVRNSIIFFTSWNVFSEVMWIG